MNNEIKLVTGNSNPELARKIGKCLSISPCSITVGKFPGGEIEVQFRDCVRGSEVYIAQPVCANEEKNISPNDALMELLIMIDAAKRASAERIIAVIPYYGYARQDRKDKPKVPITAKLVANLVTCAGANRALMLDLHANQIQGFFDIPIDHLYAINVFLQYIREQNIPNLILVSPDVGGVKMVRAYADALGCDFAIIDKRRESGTEIEIMRIIGDVRDKNAMIVDDLTSTAGTLIKGAEALKNKGALSTRAMVVHGVLAGDAIQRVEESILVELIVSDSIPIPTREKNSKIKVLSVASLLAEAITHISRGESVSSMFKNVHVER